MFPRSALLLLALYSTAALAQNAPAPQDARCAELVDTIMELDGTNEAIQQMPGQIEQGIAADFEQDTKLSEAEKRELFAALKRGLNVQTFGAELRQNYLTACEPAVFETVARLLRLPLAAKMQKLEVEVQSGSQEQQLQQFVERLNSEPPAPERVALLQRLEELVQTAEFAADVGEVTATAMMETFVGRGPSAAERAEFQQNRHKTVENLASALLVVRLFTYREVSDEELEQYVGMFESDSFRRYMGIAKAAMRTAVASQARSAAAELKKIMPQQAAAPKQ